MIKVNELKIGDILRSEYTQAEYILTELPNIFKENESMFALVRCDGCGYCYLRDSFDKVRKEIYLSGEDMFIVKNGKYIEIDCV